MESYFWFGEVLDNFLFKGLNTKSWQGILGVCAVLSALALVYEGLHVLKLFFLNRFISARKARRRESNDLPSNNTDPATSGSQPSSSSSHPFLQKRVNHKNENGSGEPAPRSLLEESDTHNGTGTIVTLAPRKSSSMDFIQLGISSALHSVYMFLGFTLMNSVMTFNVWVLIAISIGVALGYFCFGNYRRADNLIQPLNTETTSLNDSPSSTPPRPPIIDGGGDRCVDVTNTSRSPSRTPVLNRSGRNSNEESEDPGESSRLIVGAEVHTPRILSTSATST